MTGFAGSNEAGKRDLVGISLIVAALAAAVLVAAALALIGCASPEPEVPTQAGSPNASSAAPEEQPQASNVDRADYAQADAWIARPEHADQPVDVFYLCPTVWHKVADDEPNICAIDNATLREGGVAAYEQQATAFEEAGNVFAPYYRQADAAYCLSLPDDEQDALLQGVPKQDVFAALDYFFSNLNDGRPFILAGHSQGSNMLLFVLSEYLGDRPELLERMVAAYAIGYSVTDEFLAANPHLAFAEGADDTGVVVSYNTEAPGVTGENPVLLENAQVINPITWTRDEETAPADLSKGSRLDGEDRARFADATLDLERGVVVCSTADPDEFMSSPIFPRGVFHAQDYAFYYHDVRANATLRAQTYLAEHAMPNAA